MFKKIRMILALLLLAISLTLVIWAFWPSAVDSRVVPISPADLQLPTPGAFIYYWVV